MDTDAPAPLAEMVTLRKNDWDEYRDYVKRLEAEVATSRPRIAEFEEAEREREAAREAAEAERRRAPSWVVGRPDKKFRFKFPWEVIGVIAVNTMLFVWNLYMLSQTVPLVPHGLIIVGVLVFGLIALIVIMRNTFTKSVVPGAVMTLILILATVVTQGMYQGKISADPDEYVITVTTPRGGLPSYTLTILDSAGKEKQHIDQQGIEAYYRVLPTEVAPQDTILVQTTAEDATCAIQLDGTKLLEATYVAPGPLECRYTVPVPVTEPPAP
jgi:hypothetical protein